MSKSFILCLDLFISLQFLKKCFFILLWDRMRITMTPSDGLRCLLMLSKKRITRTGRVLTILFVSLFVSPKSPSAFFLISNKEWILKISCQCNFLFGKHVRFPKKTRLAIIQFRPSDHGIIYINLSFFSEKTVKSNRQ